MLADVAEMAAAVGLAAYQDPMRRPPLLEVFEQEPTTIGLAKLILGIKRTACYTGYIGDDYPINWTVMELQAEDASEVALLAAKVHV